MYCACRERACGIQVGADIKLNTLIMRPSPGPYYAPCPSVRPSDDVVGGATERRRRRRFTPWQLAWFSCGGAHPICDALSRRALNPIKLAYKASRSNSRLC